MRTDFNGYEMLRLLRKEFSIFSRSEAIHFREQALKMQIKKPTVDTIMESMREVQTAVDGYHKMLENSVIYPQLHDLRITDGDLFLLLLRNLPEKVIEHAQLVMGASNAATTDQCSDTVLHAFASRSCS